MTRRQNIPQTFYGNYSLHNRYYQYVAQAPRDLSPQDPQALEIARGSGVSIVNIRTGARTIDMEGGITGIPDPDSEQVDFQERLEFLKFFMQKQQRWLRVVPEDTKSSKVIFNPVNSTANITALDDATNVSIKEDHPQWDDYRISFDADVSSDADDQAGISFTFPAVDLSTELGTGAGSYLMPQFDFLGIKVPDEFEITEIEVRIGSDSSNYYSKTITTNYEGRRLDQGLNLLSVPFWENTKWTGSATSDDFQRSTENVTETGTVNKSSLTYGAVIFKYSDSTPDLTDFGVDAVILTDDFRVRNFPCTLSGALGVSNDWTETMVSDLNFTLLNYEAYSRSTHSIELINKEDVTTLSQDFIINLEGNTDQLPTHEIIFTDTTDIDEFKITNLRNDQVFTFTDEGGEEYADGDVLIFDGLTKKATRNGEPQLITGRIPSFNAGRSKVRYQVVIAGSTTIEYLSGETTSALDPFSNTKLAQSFTPPASPASSILSSLEIRLQGSGVSDPYPVSIQTDSGGNPSGTKLATGTVNNNLFYLTSINNVTLNSQPTLSASTVYWIVIELPANPSLFFWLRNSNNPYSGGSARSFASSTWSSETGDFDFSLVLDSVPSTDFDVKVNSPILYN